MILRSLLFHKFSLFLQGQDVRVRIKIILRRTTKGLLRRCKFRSEGETKGEVCISVSLFGISFQSPLSSGIVVTSGSRSTQSLIRFHKEKASTGLK
jgi:hypothetical protein